MNDLKESMKEAISSIPWQFRVIWLLGVLLGLSLTIGALVLIVVLIRHFI